jgi:ureidoacrylate peracid hydrolase
MPLSVRLDPREVGLLVVDMQNGFCHPDGSRGQAFGADAVSRPRQIIPNVIAAIDLAHGLDIPVWFTQQVHYGDDVTRTRRRIPSHLERRGLKLELCRRGTWDAELLDEMKAVRQERDETVVKHRSSGFFQTTLEWELRMRAVQVLIVTGTTTSFCVDSTIRDAYARDFDVVVPAECVADSDDAAHAATLASIDRFHGVVTDLSAVAAALEG